MRFLEVGAGGFLNIGQKCFLSPVEVITLVAEDRVTIEPDRTEKVGGPAPLDTKIAPPRADNRREEYASLPRGNVEETVDRLRHDHSVMRDGRWPHGY